MPARRGARRSPWIDRATVLFIVTPGSTFTLYGMAVWLANSDLDIDTALNFDGGSSSGLAVWTPTGVWGFDSVQPCAGGDYGRCESAGHDRAG